RRHARLVGAQFGIGEGADRDVVLLAQPGDQPRGAVQGALVLHPRRPVPGGGAHLLDVDASVVQVRRAPGGDAVGEVLLDRVVVAAVLGRAAAGRILEPRARALCGAGRVGRLDAVQEDVLLGRLRSGAGIVDGLVVVADLVAHG